MNNRRTTTSHVLAHAMRLMATAGILAAVGDMTRERMGWYYDHIHAAAMNEINRLRHE